MGVYKINSYRGALSDYEDKGIAGSFKFGTNMDVRKEKDTLSATQALVDETGVTFTDLIRFVVEASDGNSYGFGKAGKIYKRTSAGVWSLVYTDPYGEIKGAEEWFHQSGAYLYWATSVKLNRKKLPGETDWSDVNVDSGWPKRDLSAANFVSLQPGAAGKDAHVISNDADSNFESSTTVGIGFRTGTAGIGRAYFQFDLSGIPAGSTIVSAVLAIYALNTDESEAGNRTYEVHEVEASWDDATLTWNNQPAFNAAVADSVVINANTTGFKNFTGLKTLIQTLLDGTNNGFMIKVNNEAAAPSMNYASSDHATATRRPSLIINYIPSGGSAIETLHTMTKVSGDLLIANREKIALVGYDESYSSNVLNLIPGHIAKTITERMARASIGTHHPNTPNKGVNGVIDTEVPLAQIGDDGQIFYGDLASPIPLKRMPGGGQVNPGGVDKDIQESTAFFEWQHSFSDDPDVNSWINKKAIAGIAYFGVFNADSGKGGVYSYGRKNKNHPFVLNLEYLFDADEVGAVKVVNGTLVFGYELNGEYGIKKVNPSVKATATYEGLDWKAPTKVPAAITQWKTAEIFSAPLPAGTTIEFWYRTDKNGDFVQAKMEDGTVQFTDDGQQKSVFNLGVAGEIFEPRVVLNPTANLCPEVYEIKTLFS